MQDQLKAFFMGGAVVVAIFSSGIALYHATQTTYKIGTCFSHKEDGTDMLAMIQTIDYVDGKQRTINYRVIEYANSVSPVQTTSARDLNSFSERYTQLPNCDKFKIAQLTKDVFDLLIRVHDLRVDVNALEAKK